jgi:hypothetical protein
MARTKIDDDAAKCCIDTSKLQKHQQLERAFQNKTPIWQTWMGVARTNTYHGRSNQVHRIPRHPSQLLYTNPLATL